MSDFLGRLAARTAESATPAIAPRSVSRFEATPLAVQHAVVEAAAPMPSGPPLASVREPSATAERHATQKKKPADDTKARPEREEIRPVERVMPMQTRVEQILKEVETLVTTSTVVEHTRERVRDPVVTSPVVPRIEKAAVAPSALFGRTSVAERHAAESEPTVIRVHIGRVEVRTPSAQTDRPRVRSVKRSDPPKPMSLDRYLSGKDRS
jgi:hypothetical protein